MDEMEEWCIIDEAPNFSVSNYGRVHNDITGKFVKASPTRNGYLKVNLSHERHYFQRLVHILVATAFVPGREPGLEVIPLDGIKTNVYFGNLKWGTRQENVDRSFRDGRIPRRRVWVLNDDGVFRDEVTGEPFTEDTVFRVPKEKRNKKMLLSEWMEKWEAKMEAKVKEQEEKQNRLRGR